MTALTTHVLNISNGKPANNLHIELVFYQGTKKIKLGNFITNKDGRIDQPILSGKNFKIGTYKIIFNVKDYLLKNKLVDSDYTFYDKIGIKFNISNINQHYHIPLLLSPYGYSTYRGS